MLDSHIVSLTIFFPLIGILIILFQDRESVRAVKAIGLLTSITTFLLSLYLYLIFDASNPNMQLTEHVQWIKNLNVSYFVGVDGISLLLVMLTTLLTPIALLSSWQSIQRRLKEYVIMMLLLEVGMVGVFCSLDLFLFYVFWELVLIPMYFIIGVWGDLHGSMPPSSSSSIRWWAVC